MYDDRKEKFSFKSFFLTLLLVLLFIFLMLFLFPNRWDVKDLQSNYDLERLSVLYDEIFANNVARMKDAAIGYFTNERMPQTVGESKKLTLQEMYDLHLVLKMKDKDGKACDAQRSYVEMTKYDDEYRLKVNLSCGGYEDYIIVYLGCYNYCEKQVSKPTNTQTTDKKEDPKPEDKYSCKVVNGKYYDKNGNVVNKTEYDKSCNPKPDEKYSCEVVNGKYYDKAGNVVSKAEYDESCNPKPEDKYLYEYKLETKDSTTCTAWSNWQTTVVKATDTRQVETKKEKQLTGYDTKQVQVGTKVETITKKVTEKFIARYTTELVVVGTKQVQVGTTTKQVTEQVQVGTVEKNSGKIGSGTRVPENTSTTIYKVISVDKPDSCSECQNQTIYTWEIWNVEPVYDVVTKTVNVPVYKTVNIYEKKEVPVYDYRVVEKKEKKYTPVYKEVKVPKYSEITYYRYKDCTTQKGTVDVQWSEKFVDPDLIKKGYVFTGKMKKA